MHPVATTSFTPDHNALEKALAWLDSSGHAAQWPDRTLFKLRLCLDELLTNITMYGYPEERDLAGEPRVQLELLQQDRTLTLVIMDNGLAFDPTAQVPRELDTSLDDARIGGHGLRLLQHYLEDVRYERLEGWNRLELVATLDDT